MILNGIHPDMSNVRYSILVVDDEPAQRQLLEAVLEKDYCVEAASDGNEATSLLQKKNFDLIITDERMPGTDGIELIRWVRDQSLEIPIIVLTAFGSVETAVEAMKL